MSGLEQSISESLQILFKDSTANHIFCFHSINPTVLFPDFSSVNCQIMSFDQNYQTTMDFKSYYSRYTNGCNLIFRTLDAPTAWPFLNTFWNFLFRITTVLVYFSSRTLFLHGSLFPSEKNFLLLKLVIYPERAGNLNVRLLCNDYCEEHSETLNASIIREIINDPVGVHNLHFFNANQKVVQASVFARFWFYFEPDGYGNDRLACSRFVMKSIHMKYCTYEIMASITLSEVHNVSVLPYSKQKTSEAHLINTSIRGQYILTSIQYINHKDLFHFKRSGFQFANYVAKKVVYCLVIGEHKNAINHTIWLNPFGFEIWIVIIIFIIALPLPFITMRNSMEKTVQSILQDVLHLIGMFFRVSVPIEVSKGRFYIAAS